MKTVKNIALVILGIVVGAYGLYFAGLQGWLQGTPLEGVDHQQFNLLGSENLQQAKLFSSRAQQTSDHVKQVLGDTIQVDQDSSKTAGENSQNQSIQERTFEYARYLYCQQVVEDWESQN